MFHLLITIYLLTLAGFSWAKECPCSNVTYCESVQYNHLEVFGHVLESNEITWNTFDWTKLTTISMVNFFDEQLMCLAHQHNVRALKQENFDLIHVDNTTYVNSWIKDKLSFAKENFLDGIDLIVDNEVPKNSALVQKLTKFVELVTESFHNELPNSKVVFDVPWSPYNEKKNGVDDKNYDFVGISKIVDLLYIMEYEQRSQSFEEPCMAGANINFYYTLGALIAYRNLTIDMSKMILGLPYYAHDYVCLSMEKNLHCYIKPIEYRGIKCSSRVATIIPYNQMNSIKKNMTVSWDEHSSSPVGIYKDNVDGMTHQVWYDQSNTLAQKINLVLEAKLGGMGMWTLNYMDKDMWKNIPNYKSGH